MANDARVILPVALDYEIVAQWLEEAQPLVKDSGMSPWTPMTILAFYYSRKRGFVGTTMTFADSQTRLMLISYVLSNGESTQPFVVGNYDTVCRQLRRKYHSETVDQFAYFRSLADRVYRRLGKGGPIPDPDAVLQYDRVHG